MSRLTFSPSPLLGACVTACDTPLREHGCRGNVYTRYTFVARMLATPCFLAGLSWHRCEQAVDSTLPHGV